MSRPTHLLSALLGTLAVAGLLALPASAQTAKSQVKTLAKTQAKTPGKVAIKRGGFAKAAPGNRVCGAGLKRQNGGCVPRGAIGSGSTLKRSVILLPGQRFESAMPTMADYASFGLPAPVEGATYYRIGQRVVTVDQETRVITAVTEIADE